MAKALAPRWALSAPNVLNKIGENRMTKLCIKRQKGDSRLELQKTKTTRTAQRRQPLVAASAAAEASPAVPPQDEPKASKPTTAEFAKTILELGEEGSLSTNLKGRGLPLGTHVAYVLDASGRPILALPSNSVALENLEADNQCSLHVQIELPGLQKPQVTLCGKASPPEDAATSMRLELAWNRKHGDNTLTGSSGQPALWQLSVESVLVAADVDQEPVWITSDEYLDADADPLREVARSIVEDMNREHWQDLGRVCHAYAGMEDEVDQASITWLDRLGFDMRVWARPSMGDSPAVVDVRIPFSREANDEREARSNITMMVQVAWEKERNYNPQMPSIIPAAPVADA